MTPRVVLDQCKRGPYGLELRPGRHGVELLTNGRLVRTEHVDVEHGEAVLVAFGPPNRRPLAALREERWCVKRLDPTHHV